MEEIKSSSRVLLVSAVALLIILLTGPLGYKFSLVPLQPSLVSLLIAMVGGLLVFLVGIYFVISAVRSDLPRNRNLVLVAMVLGLVPAAIIGPQMSAAGEVPPIHDITTDTANPPVFVALMDVRTEAPNGAEYGGAEGWSPETLAETTLGAYPDLGPVLTDQAVDEATERAATVLGAMGLEVVDVDTETGRVEATATTFWFGFKDDMVVRVQAEGEGSRIDLRSMSRVGQSDIGANAARIMQFMEQY